MAEDKKESLGFKVALNLIPYLALPPYWLWCSTLRISYVNQEKAESIKEGVVSAFWHNRLFPTVYLYKKYRPVIMVSRSKDGEIISKVIEKVGMGTVRGSSSKGGKEALREMVRLAGCKRPLVVIPDGPRGPKYQAKAGAVIVAQKTGLPLLPLSMGFSRAKELGSWDGFLVPYPFSRLVVVYGEPKVIGPEADVEEERLWLQEELIHLTNEAERLAREG